MTPECAPDERRYSEVLGLMLTVSRNDVVYTSDLADLGKLQVHFPGVRIMSASAPDRG